MAKQLITLTVNGDEHEIAVAPYQTLLEVLRDDLDLIGTKRGVHRRQLRRVHGQRRRR